MTVLPRHARRHLATLSLMIMVLTASVTSGSAASRKSVSEAWGMGVSAIDQGHGGIASLASTVLAFGWVPLIWALVGIAAVVGLAERVMGSWRTPVVFVVTGVLGAWGGAGLEAVELLMDGDGAARDGGRLILDPLLGVVGTLLAASAFAEQLWRRRIRVVGFAVLLLLVLYGGGASDGARVVAGLAGLILGMVLAPSHGRWLRIPPSSHHEARLLLSSVTLLMAVGPFATLLSGRPLGPVHPLLALFRDGADVGVVEACTSAVATPSCRAAISEARMDGLGPVLLALLPLVLLGIAAWALARGRRAGVWLAASLLALSSLFFALFSVLLPLSAGQGQVAQSRGLVGATVVAVVVPAVVAAVLLGSREHFAVRSTSRARFVFGVTGVSALLVGVTAAFAVLGDTADSVGEWLLGAAELLVPAGFLNLRLPVRVPASDAAQLLLDWTGPALWIAVVVAGVKLVLSAPHHAGTPDISRVRALLRAGTAGSLGHMATWPGNSYWFGPGERSVVAYRVVSDVALTVGGPIGPECERAAAVRGFAAFCDAHGWAPAFYSVDTSLTGVFSSMGWPSVEVAQDALIVPETFTLAGGRWKDIRTAINRAGRSGVRGVWTSWSNLTLGEKNQVRVISEEWVAGRHLPEMGFTLGGVDELADADVRLMVAVTDTGSILAVTGWLPTWCEGRVVGWTLDLMRRRTTAMNGVMEFLIAETVHRAKREGLAFVSLSGAPLAGVAGGGRETTIAEQMLGYVGRRLESVYGFRSLLTFKQKFGPEFRSLYLAYPDSLVLPRIAVALTRAYLPPLKLPQVFGMARALLGGSTPPSPAPRNHVDVSS